MIICSKETYLADTSSEKDAQNKTRKKYSDHSNKYISIIIAINICLEFIMVCSQCF